MARWPEPPEVLITECVEGKACMTVEDLLKLTIFLGDIAEVKSTADSCPYVVYRD